MLALLAPLTLLVAPAAAQGQYSVILAVTTDADGKVVEVTVSKVIDPRRGTAPVKVEVEAEWLAAARAKIEARDFPHEAKTVYTYYFYTPGIPFSAL